MESHDKRTRNRSNAHKTDDCRHSLVQWILLPITHIFQTKLTYIYIYYVNSYTKYHILFCDDNTKLILHDGQRHGH